MGNASNLDVLIKVAYPDGILFCLSDTMWEVCDNWE